MKQRIFDFSAASKRALEWGRPSELSNELKMAALRLSAIEDSADRAIAQMQRRVLDACEFLDCIVEKEVEL